MTILEALKYGHQTMFWGKSGDQTTFFIKIDKNLLTLTDQGFYVVLFDCLEPIKYWENWKFEQIKDGELEINLVQTTKKVTKLL